MACSTFDVPYSGTQLSGRETERSGAKNYQKRPWARVGRLASRSLCLCRWGAGIGHVPSIPGDEQMELGGFGAFAQAGGLSGGSRCLPTSSMEWTATSALMYPWTQSPSRHTHVKKKRLVPNTNSWVGLVFMCVLCQVQRLHCCCCFERKVTLLLVQVCNTIQLLH